MKPRKLRHREVAEYLSTKYKLTDPIAINALQIAYFDGHDDGYERAKEVYRPLEKQTVTEAIKRMYENL